MKDFLFNGNKELRKAWEEADAQGKRELEEIDDFITSQPKDWKDQFVSLPPEETGAFVMESMQEYKHFLEVAKKETDKDIRNKLLSCTHEERKGFYIAAAEEQRRILFKEPWLLRNFDYETRMEILTEYAPEQQANMKARMDLEDDFRREKRKGFG